MPVSFIGRSAECQIVITDPRASRQHAMIRKQDGGYYLFDLGSFNGSYLNGSRVTSAHQLRDGDLLSFADHEFYYREGREKSVPGNLDELGGATIALIRSTPVILLVSDIKGFTALSEAVEADELAQIIGGWYSDCERILGEEEATVDKFIGDSVLAYWTQVGPETLRAALRAAEGLLASCDRILGERPDVFERAGRNFEVGVALHVGKVAYGGMSHGEFTLLGDPVNLVFRLEAMTRDLATAVVVSGDFLCELPDLLPYLHNHGVHRVRGRARGVEVFSLERFPEA